MERNYSLEQNISGGELQERSRVINVPYLTNLFRDIKGMDMLSQGAQSAVSWQERYAVAAKERLQQELGDNAPEFFEGKKFADFLENTEYTHNADWPEYFGLVLQDYFNGHNHEAEVSEFTDSPEIPEIRERLDKFYLELAGSKKSKNQELIFLADLLKKTKKAHLQFQEKQGSSVPWAEWYAENLVKPLQEKFGGKGVPIDKEVLKKVLDEAEEMHTAEWPITYATAITEEIQEIDHLSSREKKSFLTLKKAAHTIGRIEKIPNGNARRKYLALNLKRLRGAAASDAVESELDEKLDDAENFSPQGLKEREEYKEIIAQGVDTWVEQEKITESYLTKEQLAQLVKFLSEAPEYRDAVYAITDNFSDRSKYRKRPSVLAYESGKNKMNIDLWLLGWRPPKEGQEIEAEDEGGVPSYLAGPDGTYIHDHEATEVGIQVLDYDPVTEVLYSTENTRTAAKSSQERKYYNPNLPEEERVYDYAETERQFTAGTNLKVGAPYIHQFRGPQGKGKYGMAATMHAYSVNPEAIPADFTPENLRGKQKKAGCYKMNYFLKVHDKQTGEKKLKQVGYYTMLKPDGQKEKSEFYMEGVVEGVTSLKDLPDQKGEWMFC